MKQNNELTIIVAGGTASGKSTITLLLEQFLLEKGFTVKLELENELFDYGTEEQFRKTMAENFTKREENIMKKSKITLKQAQLKRDAYHKKE